MNKIKKIILTIPESMHLGEFDDLSVNINMKLTPGNDASYLSKDSEIKIEIYFMELLKKLKKEFGLKYEIK